MDNGLHASNGEIQDPNFRTIGNVELIDKRSRHDVEVGPGGTLGDYIPFYFTPFSVMMFNIHTAYNVPHVPNEEIVILVSSLHRVAKLRVRFVFTDKHACLTTANYFTDLKDLDKVGWDILNRRDFRRDPDDPGKMERYQAEALVWRHLPFGALLGICCYSPDVGEEINAELAKRDLEMQTNVQREWYF